MHPLVPQLITKQARRAPDAAAVADPASRRRLSYGELERRSRRLALGLRSLGVGPEVRVGLLLVRSPEMVVAVLAVLRSGGAYVPLDPSYPRERLRLMARDAELATVVVSGDRPAGEIVDGVPLVDVSAAAPARAGQDLGLPGRIPSQSAAYVIYTSGSSGRPKGVVVPHRSLAWHARAATSVFAFCRRDRVLQLSALSFDLSVLEMLPVLICGATVVLRDESMAASVDAFFARCRDESVTVAFPSTSLWHEMAAAAARGESLPPSLRLVAFGTERASAERVNDWLRALGSADRPRLVNGYGATETTVDATACELTGRAPDLRRVPIGKPIPGVEVRVVDRRLGRVARGGEGELAVAGSGVARGYLGQPGATARVFVPRAGAERPGERLYRTGDRGRWVSDGELEVLGRVDLQVKVRGFRVEPEEIEAVLERHPAVRLAAVVPTEGDAGSSRLLAFVVPRPGVRLADEVDGIRAELRVGLPAHMVPAAFVGLGALPMTPSKKVDRRALSRMDAPPEVRRDLGEPEAPRTAAEAALAEIWAGVLGLERVGVHESFFDLGGDSILNLRIAARAHAAGLDVDPGDVFRHPTVAELAALSRPVAPPGVRTGAEPGAEPPAGPARPTPIQRWFFELDPRQPWHFNQSQLLELRRPIAAGVLRRAFVALVERHDAFRLRAERAAGWRLSRAPADGRGPVVHVDFSRLPGKLAGPAQLRASNEVQSSLDLAAGPLLRAALFDCGRARRGRPRPARLLIAVHHLAVDTVSWHVLLEELETLCRDLADGRGPSLPAPTTPYAEWSERVEEHAGALDHSRVLEPWEKRPAVPPLPRDFAGGTNVRASVGTVRASLDAERTRLLLRRVPAAYRTRINDVLLTALAQTLTRWTGGRALLVELESHGREDLFDGVDLSRTVGWFTTSYPLALELPESGGPGEALKAVKEQIRAVPGNGFDFFALRFASRETSESRRIRELARAEISFNYLGQLDVLATASFRLLRDDSVRVSPRGRREHLFEVEGAVLLGRFEIRWHYSRHLHRRATVERLARDYLARLDALISHCLAPGAGGPTPSDFPLAGLAAADLDAAVGTGRGVEDVYPLTALQQGFLFHSLYAPESPVYFEQYDWSLAGEVDVGAFRRAWQTLVDRHPILRTGFAWRDLPHPVQVVRRRVVLPWRETACLLEADHQALAAEDRRRGFDLGAAPLMRCLLVSLGQAWRFVWSVHHLLVDGWSVGLLVEEVMTLYAAFRRGRPAGRRESRPFRDYVAWLAEREAGVALRFWSRELEGFEGPTPLAMAEPGAPTDSVYVPHGELERQLTAPDTECLDAFARRHRLTWGTLMAGAWAVVLARTSGRQDVVFGTTLAERPRSLAGAESIVGPLIRTVPVRVRLDGAERLTVWLERLRDQLVKLRRHGYGSLADIRSRSAAAADRELFESILGFHNYPGGAALAERRGAGLHLADLRYFSQTNYPLLVEGHLEGGRLLLRSSYDALRFRSTAVTRTLCQVRRVLEGFQADAEVRLGWLSLLGAAESHQLVHEWGRGDRGAEPASPSLDGLFRQRAAIAPDAPAVVFEPDGGPLEETVTFAELERRARNLAGRLRRRGVGAERRAGVFMERSVEMIAAILGVLEAGGAFVPLEPGEPDDRLSFSLDDSGVSLVLTDARLAGRLRGLGYGAPIVHPADAPGRGEPAPSSGEGTTVEALHAAYVIYTSGSTGRPKGAVVPHGAIVNHLAWAQALCGLDGRDRALVRIPPTFDASVLETFLPLVHGACLVLARAADRADPRYLLELMDRHRITTVVTLTSVMRMLSAEHEAGGGGARRYLRRVVCGGEAMSATDQERFRAAFPAAVFFHHYGPTETAVGVTFQRCDAPDPPPRLPIGRPGSRVDVFLSDRRGLPVGHGLAGELQVGGVQLARGYLGRPCLTAERFVPRALAAHPGGRLYRTGDLARRKDDGALELLGRVDRQVKIRGVRVELGEVESVLAAHPAVRQAALLSAAGAGGAGESRLVAFVAPETTRAEGPHVTRMHALYDDLFSRLSRRGGDDYDSSAWRSSTGKPVPEDEIRDWLAATLARLEALEPRRVLEIGCGTGLVLMRIAERAERVVGTDFSDKALDRLEERFRERGWRHGTFLCRQADDFAGIEKGAFDTVIFHSVVQCLPGARYLLRSLRGAVEAAAPGGRVYLGDVFSRPLLEAKWVASEVELGGVSQTVEELRRKLDWHRRRNEHLAVDPAFFLALRHELRRIRDVKIHLRGGRRRTELSRFSYDVTLYLDRPLGARSLGELDLGGPVWLGNREAADPERLRRRLEDNRRRPRILGLRAVADRRLWPESKLIELLGSTPGNARIGDLWEAAERMSEGGVEPDDIEALCRETGHELEVAAHSSHPPGVGGRYDLILRPAGAAAAAPIVAPRPWSAYVLQPAAAADPGDLERRLRGHVRRWLPEALRPAAYVVLDDLPRLASGKVDRVALGKLERGTCRAGPPDAAAAHNDTERVLAEIWRELLELEAGPGVDDNVFELGAHSLLATQAASRIRRRLSVDLPLRRIFEAPTVALLARAVEEGSSVPADDEPDLESRHVEQWRALAEQLHAPGRRDPAGADFDTAGWNSSYTDQPIPLTEMREWVAGTVERLLAFAPRRVLEIGCGTGLLLLEVAPRTDHYLGTDLSAAVLAGLAARLRASGLGQVALRRRSADDFAGVEPGSFDTAVLNSVVQYFPSIDYLRRVLRGAAEAVAESGRIFVGDVRNLCLHEAFCASVELHRAEAAGEDVASGELGERIRRRRRRDDELLVDPAFFFALRRELPRITGVRLLPKWGTAKNEMTLFRYDVVLELDAVPADPDEPEWRTWPQDLAVLGQLLERRPRRGVGVRGVPDSRLQREVDLLESLAASEASPDAFDEIALSLDDGVEPEELRALGREQGYELEWAGPLFGQGGRFDVLWRPLGEPPAAAPAAPTRPWSSYGNDPLARARAEGLTAAPEAPPVLRARPRPAEVPLSFAQQRLWFLERLTPGLTAFNMFEGWYLEGELDPAALEAAWREVVRRHEVLRTRFPSSGGRPRQEIVPYRRRLPPLPVVDLGRLGPEPREREVRRLAHEHGVGAFDLARDLPLRLRLLICGEGRHVLLRALHHIASDGWSDGLLAREVSVLYAAARAGRRSPLPEPAVQYADFSLWQREWLAGATLDRHLSWWRARLAGVPRLELPADRPRPAVRAYRGGVRRLAFAPRRVAALNALAARHQASLFMTLLAAFTTLLGRYSGQQDFAVGSPIAHRNHRELEDLVGFFVNSLALRADLSGSPRFDRLLDRVRRSTLAAYAHQDLPFELLVKELRPERELDRHPLFEVVLGLLSTPVEMRLAGLELHPLLTEREPLTVDMEWHLWEIGGALEGYVVYDEALFDPVRIERMVRHFERLLDSVARDPELPADGAWLSAAEMEEVRTGWTGGPAAPAVEHEADTEPSVPAPASLREAETVLLAIWSELLEIDHVEVRDNFFELGGHSLLATRVASRVRDILRVELPVRSFFERPTVAQLAIEIARRQAHNELEEARVSTQEEPQWI